MSASLLLPGRLSRLGCAVHEAGHSVAYLVEGTAYDLDSVSIWRTSRGQWEGLNAGHVCHWQRHHVAIPWAPGFQDEGLAHLKFCARRDCVNHLAGPVAEMRWRLRARTPVWMNADANAKVCFGMEHDEGSDYQRVAERVRYLAPDDPHALFVELFLETEAMVARNWSAIVDLGRTLAERQSIPGDEVSAWWEARQAA